MLRNLFLRILGLSSFKTEMCEIIRVAFQLQAERIKTLEGFMKTQLAINQNLIDTDQRQVRAMQLFIDEWDDLKEEFADLKQMKHIQ